MKVHKPVDGVRWLEEGDKMGNQAAECCSNGQGLDAKAQIADLRSEQCRVPTKMGVG